jgi:uncharacterized protein (TIGR01244 family)
MTGYLPLSPGFSVSAQIEPGALPEIARLGFGHIVNNRPDGEVPGQPDGADIEAAAHAAGLGYTAIPVDHSGFSVEQVAAMSACMLSAKPVLAFCRSGTRSAMLWALASASRGMPEAEIVAAAAGAGYDVRSLLPALRSLQPGDA